MNEDNLPFQDLPDSAKIRFLAQNSQVLLNQLNVAEKQIADLTERNKKQERQILELVPKLEKNHSEPEIFDIFRNELIEELRKLSAKIADQETIAMYSEIADMITRLKKSGKKMRKTLL